MTAPARDASWTDLASLIGRWTLASAVAGAAIGVAEAAGLGGTATLLLPGVMLGLAQRLAAPGRVPALWTLFSGLAWIAGVLLDATMAFRPEGLGLWLVPTATMALWQSFLLGDLRRAWAWFPVSIVAAAALQASAQLACSVGCAPLAQSIAPSAATVWTYLAGFAGYGLTTGLALPFLAQRSRR